jgi:hypothetical protein
VVLAQCFTGRMRTVESVDCSMGVSWHFGTPLLRLADVHGQVVRNFLEADLSLPMRTPSEPVDRKGKIG